VVTIRRGRACGKNEFVLRREWEVGRHLRRVSNTRGSPLTYCGWKLPEHWTVAELRAG
jgi:hypothetical protein